MRSIPVTYFDETSEKDPERLTQETLALAKKRADELGIKRFILASSTGLVARRALDALGDRSLVIVGEDRSWYDEGLLKELEEKKVPVIFSREVRYDYPAHAQDALRRLCEGAKVCPEIVMMAVDKQAIRGGEEVMAVAGTGSGADTAMVIVSARTTQFGKLRIRELVCKPR